MNNSFQQIPTHWQIPLIQVFAIIFLSLTIFFETWQSIVSIWYRSSTFNHGFLIAPISIWLIWQQRQHYKSLQPKTNGFGLILVLTMGFAWLLAELISVQVVKQFAVIAMLLAAIGTVLGLQLIRQLLFPLSFLLFMVPVGEELILPLMEFTANFTVWMLRLTGIIVYREGFSFALPTGNWSVVEACSGINYLIASITLGTVFAYLSYSLWWKRIVFTLLSIIVPIIANGFRAYMIVMIGHLSGMKLAVGVDHLIYGGIFFGLVMAVLFYLGSFFKDPIKAMTNDLVIESNNTHRPVYFPLTMILIMAINFAVWPVTETWLSRQAPKQDALTVDFAILQHAGWHEIQAPLWYWRPSFPGATAQTFRYFQQNADIIAVYQVSFSDESQNSGELVNSQNLVVANHDLYWRIAQVNSIELKLSRNTQKVNRFVLAGKEHDLLLLRWYEIGRYVTANDYMAKLYQLTKRLTADSAPEKQVIFAIPAPKNTPEHSLTVLKSTAEAWLNRIRDH